MAVMDPFATPQMMSDRTRGEITATTHPFLDSELKAASRTIRNFCRWHVAPRLTLTTRRRGRFAEHYWLPAMEIQEITAVAVDGTAWTDLDTVEFDSDTGWTNLCGRVVEVSFVAGFAEVPDDIAQLTLELAAGGLGTALNIGREQAGGVSVTYTRSSGELIPADRDRLLAYQLGRLP